MDAKTRDLALLAFLSLFCAVSAWAGDRDVFGSVNLCYRIRADQPGRSMPITPFLGDQKFDPETKRIMGVAFEMARAAIGCPSGADAIIAKRIIELAKAGERNTERLSEFALDTLRSQ